MVCKQFRIIYIRLDAGGLHSQIDPDGWKSVVGVQMQVVEVQAPQVSWHLSSVSVYYLIPQEPANESSVDISLIVSVWAV